jgi:hypothetical protein
MSTLFSEQASRQLHKQHEADNRGIGEAVIAMLWFVFYVLIIVAALSIGSPLLARTIDIATHP